MKKLFALIGVLAINFAQPTVAGTDAESGHSEPCGFEFVEDMIQFSSCMHERIAKGEAAKRHSEMVVAGLREKFDENVLSTLIMDPKTLHITINAVRDNQNKGT